MEFPVDSVLFFSILFYLLDASMDCPRLDGMK